MKFAYRLKYSSLAMKTQATFGASRDLVFIDSDYFAFQDWTFHVLADSTISDLHSYTFFLLTLIGFSRHMIMASRRICNSCPSSS
jgi:hypothetical protein